MDRWSTASYSHWIFGIQSCFVLTTEQNVKKKKLGITHAMDRNHIGNWTNELYT
jgi:hypothetical protein